MAALPRIALVKPVARHVRLGHPFVFREALRLPAGLQAGDVADLHEGGAFVARGTVDPSSPLAFRVWTLDPDERVDEGLLRARLAQAAALRRDVIDPAVTGFRLCHGENDRIPALQCDLYDGVASLRTDGAIGLAWEPRFVRAVEETARPRAVVARNPLAGEGKARVLRGTVPEELIIEERGRRLAVDVLHGQKTGAFLDQRDNRDRVAALARGRSVLNLFCYTGGFSVAAALGGARRVVSADLARPAVEAARRNFALNGLDADRHGFEVGDAFELLERLAARAPEHDLVVVDPPAFAPSQKALAPARKAYVRLNELALRALPDGGWLASSSCSSHLREKEFLELLAEAARRARRSVTVSGVFGAAPDHPTRPGFPEGHYLKFVLLRVG